jgi:probable F420-dependent oxidoreductase
VQPSPASRPKIGVILPESERSMDGETPRWRDIVTMACAAEEVGFDSIWLTDHLIFEGEDGPFGPWESWSVVAALAAATSRVEIGTFVSCVSFRNPALFAKMADTVDEVSGGRLILGLGAGWNEPEFRAFGYPFDYRVSRFEEAIQIIAPLLREGRVDFDGRFYQARDCELRPRGPRPKGLPIMVGTSSPRMLRIAARFADLWNGLSIRPDGVPALNARVDEACRDVGRDPLTLDRTVETRIRFPGLPLRRRDESEMLSGPPEELAAALAEYTSHGVAHLQLRVRPNTTAGVEAFGRVLEQLDRR